MLSLFFLGCTSAEKKNQNIAFNECNLKASINPVCPEDIQFINQIKSEDATLCMHIGLRNCAEQNGPDYAAAAFYISESKQPKSIFMKRYLRNSPPAQPVQKNNRILLGMIPGMFYDSNRKIGGDGGPVRISARKMNIDEEIIPVEPAGSMELNGERICTWLKDRRNNKIIIASLSKGAGDFLSAYQICGKNEEFKNIIGWLNLVGINKGIYLAEKLEHSFISRQFIKWKMKRNGYSYSGIRSLRPANFRSLSHFSPEFPVINVIAAPAERHISERARETYRLLLEYGPNDGLTLLEDAPFPFAYNLVIYGTDHYLNVENPENFIDKMLIFFINYKGQKQIAAE